MGLSVTKTIYFFLGIFEFIMVFKLLVFGDYESFDRDFALYPSEFVETAGARNLLLCWTFFLGLLRISWVVSENGLGSWICGSLIHVAEG